jgi:hypothetical protein
VVIANHEGSAIDFPGLPGIFDQKYGKTASGWLPSGVAPYSGVIAQAVQTVAVTAKIAADNLLSVGTRGQAGYVRKFGGIDLTVDGVLTSNYLTSGAIGYQLSDFDNILPSGFTLWTTNGVLGKSASVSGLYVTSISFTFNQNAESTTSWQFIGNGIIYSGYTVATQGQVGYGNNHCVDPLTWDEISLYDGKDAIVLTGVQSATFTATINRTDIYEIGQFVPYDRVVVYPYSVAVTMNTLANEVPLVNWWSKFVPTYDPTADCNNQFVIKVRTGSIQTNYGGGGYDMIIASGLRPTQSTLNTAVGANSTVNLSFEGTSMYF